MASSRLMIIPLLLSLQLLFHGNFASHQPQQSQPRLRGQSECQIDRITAREPNRRVQSEAGVSEFWISDENDELECAGVEAVRHTINPKGLLLPYYPSTPELGYVVRGRGLQGTVFSGCPETFETTLPSESGKQQIFDQHQRVYRYNEGDILALPAGAVHWTYNDGDSPIVIVVLRDRSNVANQLDRKFRKFFLAGNPQSQQDQEGRRGRQEDRPGRQDDRRDQQDDRRAQPKDRRGRQDDRPGRPEDRRDQPEDRRRPQDDRRDQPEDRSGRQVDRRGRPEDNRDQPEDHRRRQDDRRDQPEDRRGRQDDRSGRPEDRRGRQDENRDEPEDRRGRQDDRRDQPEDHRRQHDDRRGHGSNRQDEPRRDRDQQDHGDRRRSDREEEGEEEGSNIFNGFDDQILQEVFKVDFQTIIQLNGRDDRRGPIVNAENFHVGVPEDEQQQQQSRRRSGERGGSGRDNGIEETLCSTQLRANIANPAGADVYNPRGGRTSILNGYKLPILNTLQLSAERGVLYKNALLAPHYNLNAHSIIYITSGNSRLQIVKEDGSAVFDGEVREGQLIVVPQNFAVIKKASEQGCEWVAFKTNENALTTQLAGRFSFLRALPEEVLVNSYQISQEQAKQLKYNRQEGVVLSPSSESTSRRAKNALLNVLFS